MHDMELNLDSEILSDKLNHPRLLTQWSSIELPEEMMNALKSPKSWMVERFRDKDNFNYLEGLHNLYFSTDVALVKQRIAHLVVDQRRSPLSLEILFDDVLTYYPDDSECFSLMGLADDSEALYTEYEEKFKHIRNIIEEHGFVVYSNWLYKTKGKQSLYLTKIEDILKKVEECDLNSILEMADAYKYGTFLYKNEEQYNYYMKKHESICSSLVSEEGKVLYQNALNKNNELAQTKKNFTLYTSRSNESDSWFVAKVKGDHSEFLDAYKKINDKEGVKLFDSGLDDNNKFEANKKNINLYKKRLEKNDINFINKVKENNPYFEERYKYKKFLDNDGNYKQTKSYLKAIFNQDLDFYRFLFNLHPEMVNYEPDNLGVQTDGRTLLWVAFQYGNVERINFLLDHGANANYVCALGNSINSWVASMASHIESKDDPKYKVVKRMLDSGLDLTLRGGTKGDAILEFLDSSFYSPSPIITEILDLFKEYGADPENETREWLIRKLKDFFYHEKQGGFRKKYSIPNQILTYFNITPEDAFYARWHIRNFKNYHTENITYYPKKGVSSSLSSLTHLVEEIECRGEVEKWLELYAFSITGEKDYKGNEYYNIYVVYYRDGTLILDISKQEIDKIIIDFNLDIKHKSMKKKRELNLEKLSKEEKVNFLNYLFVEYFSVVPSLENDQYPLVGSLQMKDPYTMKSNERIST